MTDQGRSGRRAAPGAWFIIAPAVALVIGLVLGGLVVWAGQDDDPDAATAGSPPPAPSPSATETAGEDTAIVVPAECLAAADTVEEATEAFRDLVGAFRDFRAEELRDLLNQMETLEAQARSQADACRDVDVTGTTVPSPTSS